MKISSTGLSVLSQTLGGQRPWPRRSGQGRTQNMQGYRGEVAVSGIFWPKNFLEDLERFLVERFGFRGTRPLPCTARLGYQGPRRRIGMLWPKNLPPDPERFLVRRFSFGYFPPPFGKGIRGYSRYCLSPRCSGPRARFDDFNRSFRNGNRRPIFSLFNQLAYLLIQCIRDHRLRRTMPGMRESRGQVLTVPTMILRALEP